MKIVQFGLCFSPNLGDGVIAECIGHGVKQQQPNAEVAHIDLSGRKDFGEVVVRNRERIIRLLDKMPTALRQALVSWRLGQLLDRLEADWRDAAQADLAIVGGGQIFADASLNFPMKVGRVFDILAAERTPAAVFGVGVAKNWSPRGRALFQKITGADVRLVGVRDAGSIAAWKAQMPSKPVPELTLDPGLLARDHYGEKACTGDIGLCVTDFGILAHHATGSVAGSQSSAAPFYVDIVKEAVRTGSKVTLFCNGAAEDVALLRAVVGDPAVQAFRKDGTVAVPDMPRTPTELVHIIARCSVVIAHRLHACIVAYSYERAIVGLGWDAKLQSFFETAGMDAYFSADPEISAQEIVAHAAAAKDAGVDPERYAALVAETRDGFARLLATVSAKPL